MGIVDDLLQALDEVHLILVGKETAIDLRRRLRRHHVDLVASFQPGGWAWGGEPCLGSPAATRRSQRGTFCVTSTPKVTLSPSRLPFPPSLRRRPTPSKISGRCSTRQPAPRKPPASSSAGAP